MVQAHDSLMVALFEKLPPIGTVWPIDQRLLWLQACEGVLNLIYGPVQKIDIGDGVILPGFLSSEKVAQSEEPAETANTPAEPEKLTSEPPADREKASEPEAPIAPLKPVTSAKAPKGNRPAGLPSNASMAIEAIKEMGPSGAAAIRSWCRRKYWAQMPDAWSAGLYDLVSAGKLQRSGINFVLPGNFAKPEEPAPKKVETKAVLPRAPVRAPMPPVKPTQGARPAGAGVKFEHNGRSTELGGREYVLAGKLRVAMGKGHVSEAFLAESVMGSNTESTRDAVKSVCLGMNGRLALVGLKVEFYSGFGLVMKELA